MVPRRAAVVFWPRSSRHTWARWGGLTAERQGWRGLDVMGRTRTDPPKWQGIVGSYAGTVPSPSPPYVPPPQHHHHHQVPLTSIPASTPPAPLPPTLSLPSSSPTSSMASRASASSALLSRPREARRVSYARRLSWRLGGRLERKEIQWWGAGGNRAGGSACFCGGHWCGCSELHQTIWPARLCNGCVTLQRMQCSSAAI